MLLTPRAPSAATERAVALSAQNAVDVVDHLVRDLLLESRAAGRRDIGIETDPTLEIGAAQGAPFGAAVERVEVVDAAGKFLAEQLLVDILLRDAAQIVDQAGPDDRVGDATLISVARDLFHVPDAFDIPVKGHW